MQSYADFVADEYEALYATSQKPLGVLCMPPPQVMLNDALCGYGELGRSSLPWARLFFLAFTIETLIVSMVACWEGGSWFRYFANLNQLGVTGFALMIVPMTFSWKWSRAQAVATAEATGRQPEVSRPRFCFVCSVASTRAATRGFQLMYQLVLTGLTSSTIFFWAAHGDLSGSALHVVAIVQSEIVAILFLIFVEVFLGQLTFRLIDGFVPFTAVVAFIFMTWLLYGFTENWTYEVLDWNPNAEHGGRLRAFGIYMAILVGVWVVHIVWWLLHTFRDSMRRSHGVRYRHFTPSSSPGGTPSHRRGRAGDSGGDDDRDDERDFGAPVGRSPGGGGSGQQLAGMSSDGLGIGGAHSIVSRASAPVPTPVAVPAPLPPPPPPPPPRMFESIHTEHR